MGILEFIKKRSGLILALISLSVYIVMLFTFIMFLTTILLLILIVIIPLIIIPLFRKDKAIIIRRVKASCWAIGFLILFIFPAFWLIPQQTYVRVNRQQTLITPNDPLVVQFADEFFGNTPNYEQMSFREKGETVSTFTTQHIVWKLDYENYGMAGHVATPAECIKLRSDDCQGQAVTMASLLLNLGFEYVWVVETPFHWYVLVRDPSKGPLELGWEVNVELYQENGEVIPLNRDGEGNMPDWRLEEVVLIFNDKEILYPVNSFQAIWIGWTATAFFYDDLFPIFLTYEIIYVFLAMLLLSIPIIFWTYYMSDITNEKRTEDRKKALKIVLKRMILIVPLLFLVFFVWFLVQTIIWDYTLILAISEITIISVLASEPKFWKLLRLE